MKFTHFLLLSSLVLTGCVTTSQKPVPYHDGIPNSEAEQLADLPRQQAIGQYNAQLEKDKKNKMIYAIASGLATTKISNSRSNRSYSYSSSTRSVTSSTSTSR